MDETPSPASSSRNGSRPTSGPLGKKIQPNAAEDDGVDPIECTGKSCKSCTAGVIADCVAVSCCPCAVVDILAFTFLKIPYIMGRKWLTKGRMKMRKKEKMKRKIKENTSIDGNQNSERGLVNVGGEIGSSRKVSEGNEEVALENENEGMELENEGMELGNDEEVKEDFRAEDVWLELFRRGRLGFGRVSFSSGGSSSQIKMTTN